eukprot:CAMPEP_0175904960 /NCGR_PEP_ID=MMETSP0108-20121206/4753_1 /TAXON_ID=195067 ORGANISM="Goniomonas pacifica, Strain CCMP1869" /NCGR_SAMPLE_ID=MMETSP0108 /ASSEMBLY_ACC=CAM_ASM_000204 /LENGTH=104 /DNA_ID=CAMNT_0017226803 /DNA_START=471 /DNA_END=782 /DNA_ORIENTATION=+
MEGRGFAREDVGEENQGDRDEGEGSEEKEDAAAESNGAAGGGQRHGPGATQPEEEEHSGKQLGAGEEETVQVRVVVADRATPSVREQHQRQQPDTRQHTQGKQN